MNSIAELVKQVQELTELTQAQATEIAQLKAACDAQGVLTQKYQALALAAAQAQAPVAASADPIVEMNVAMLRKRSAVGVEKYGTTLADNKLPLRAWLNHALEETLDNANYLQAAMQTIDAAPQQHAQAAQPKCLTCNGHGLIGGLMPGDGGYHSEDCPDCDGRGFVHGEVEYRGDGYLQPPDPPTQSKCEVCDGSGKVNPADVIVPAPAQPIAGELPPLPKAAFVDYKGLMNQSGTNYYTTLQMREYARAILATRQPAPVASTPAVAVPKQPELTVWYGPMPESNGKSNFTATLMRKGASLFEPASQYTFQRSEYPDRVRYEADCMRYLIGEIDNEPFILDYDADKHSGYVEPQLSAAPVAAEVARGDIEHAARQYVAALNDPHTSRAQEERWLLQLESALAAAPKPPADAAPESSQHAGGAAAQDEITAAHKLLTKYCVGYAKHGKNVPLLERIEELYSWYYAAVQPDAAPVDAKPADHMFDEYDTTEQEIQEAVEYHNRLKVSEQNALEDAKKNGVGYINLMTGRWIPHGLLRVVKREAAQPSTAQSDALSQEAGEVKKNA